MRPTDDSAEIHRYLTICALSTPSAAIVWWIFDRVFENLTRTEAAMGYVDPVTQMGVDLGYIAMVGGTVVFAGIAIWAGFRAAETALRVRRNRR